MRKIFSVILLGMLIILFAGCSKGGDDDSGTTKPRTYSITGQITSNSTGLAGVTVSLTDIITTQTTTQTTTDSNGNYSFTNQVKGDYTVTPSLTGYIFLPSGTVVIIGVGGGDRSGIDFTATAFTAGGEYSASGTWSWDATTRTLTFNWTSCDFLCNMCQKLGTETDGDVTITSTSMTGVGGMTWTRSSGIADNPVGTWTATSNENTYTLIVKSDSTMSATGIINTCGD